MAMNLDPEKAPMVIDVIQQVCNGEILDVVVEAYQSVSASGDNNLVSEMKEKFIKIQNYYNDVLLPAMTSCKTNLEEFTDVAKYFANLSVDKTIKTEDIDTPTNANLGSLVGA